MVHDGRIRHVAAVMSDMDFGMGNFLECLDDELSALAVRTLCLSRMDKFPVVPKMVDDSEEVKNETEDTEGR